jgi:hypothetical protein
MEITSVTAIVGLMTGVAGMVLGILSTIDRVQKNRVRLKVVPKVASTHSNNIVVETRLDPSLGTWFARGREPDRLAIEIVNLSAFPVTISQVGFGSPDVGDPTLFVPEVSPGYTWPPVVESRRAVTIYHRLNPQFFRLAPLPNNVFVQTECGAVRKARSAALDWLVRHASDRKAGLEQNGTSPGTTKRDVPG